MFQSETDVLYNINLPVNHIPLIYSPFDNSLAVFAVDTQTNTHQNKNLNKKKVDTMAVEKERREREKKQRHRSDSTCCDATEKLLDLQKGVNIIYTHIHTHAHAYCGDEHNVTPFRVETMSKSIYKFTKKRKEKLFPAFSFLYPGKLISIIYCHTDPTKRTYDSNGHIPHDLPETKERRKKNCKSKLVFIFSFI